MMTDLMSSAMISIFAPARKVVGVIFIRGRSRRRSSGRLLMINRGTGKII